MERVLSDKKAICVFMLPAVLVFVAIIIFPIVMSGYYSLLDWDGIRKSTFIALENYSKLIQDETFRQSVVNSIILAFLSIFVQLPLALLLALILSNGVKGENFYRSVYFIPVIVSTVVIGQLWMKIYHPSYGLLNVFLKNIGMGSLANEWIGNTETALAAVFVPIVWQYVGYHMLLMYAAIKSIPGDVMEAAKIDGANSIQTAFRITIPLIVPILEVCVTFAVVGSLKTFDLIYVLTGGGPVHATEVPSTLMFNTIFHQNMRGYGSSMAIFIIIECLLLTVVIQRLFRLRKTN